MSEAKHTPGPWRVSGHRLAVFAKLNGINVVVADCDRTLGYSESEANARLIASAPELLAALLVAHKRITEDRASYVWGAELPDGSMDTKDAAILHEAYDSKLAQIEAAIAKATGQEEDQ